MCSSFMKNGGDFQKFSKFLARLGQGENIIQGKLHTKILNSEKIEKRLLPGFGETYSRNIKNYSKTTYQPTPVFYHASLYYLENTHYTLSQETSTTHGTSPLLPTLTQHWFCVFFVKATNFLCKLDASRHLCKKYYLVRYRNTHYL